MLAVLVRILIPFSAALALAACGQSSEQREQIQRDRADQETQESVKRLVRTTNADDQWPQRLTKGTNGRMSPVLTIDLEKVWCTGRPILFVGTLGDVRSHADGAYEVVVQYSIVVTPRHFFADDLQLRLEADTNTIDAFLAKRISAGGENFIDGVAVVAEVTGVVSESVYASDAWKFRREGRGKLLAIIETGQTEFWGS